MIHCFLNHLFSNLWLEPTGGVRGVPSVWLTKHNRNLFTSQFSHAILNKPIILPYAHFSLRQLFLLSHICLLSLFIVSRSFFGSYKNKMKPINTTMANVTLNFTSMPSVPFFSYSCLSFLYMLLSSHLILILFQHHIPFLFHCPYSISHSWTLNSTCSLLWISFSERNILPFVRLFSWNMHFAVIYHTSALYLPASVILFSK